MGIKAAGGIGKFAMKKLPFIGAAIEVNAAQQRISKGDYAGAALELTSAALSMIPGVGTLGSAAIDTALIARDRVAKAPAIQQQSNIAQHTPSAPAHIQQAFSQSSGANTQAAINADNSQGATPPKAATQQQSTYTKGDNPFVTQNVAKTQEMQREQLSALDEIKEQLTPDELFTMDNSKDPKGALKGNE